MITAQESAELQSIIARAMARERAQGVADAIRVIKAMGHDWPDAICASSRGPISCVADDYGRQFVSRILEHCPEAEQFVPVGSRNSGK